MIRQVKRHYCLFLCSLALVCSLSSFKLFGQWAHLSPYLHPPKSLGSSLPAGRGYASSSGAGGALVHGRPRRPVDGPSHAGLAAGPFRATPRVVGGPSLRHNRGIKIGPFALQVLKGIK